MGPLVRFIAQGCGLGRGILLVRANRALDRNFTIVTKVPRWTEETRCLPVHSLILASCAARAGCHTIRTGNATRQAIHADGFVAAARDGICFARRTGHASAAVGGANGWIEVAGRASACAER